MIGLGSEDERENWKTEGGRGGEGRDWSCQFLTAVRIGLCPLSREVITSYYWWQRSVMEELGEARGTDNCIQYFHSAIILTVKLNSSPDHYFSSSLFLGPGDGKHFSLCLRNWKEMTIPPSETLILQLIIHNRLFLYQSNNHANQAATASAVTGLQRCSERYSVTKGARCL